MFNLSSSIRHLQLLQKLLEHKQRSLQRRLFVILDVFRFDQKVLLLVQISLSIKGIYFLDESGNHRNLHWIEIVSFFDVEWDAHFASFWMDAKWRFQKMVQSFCHVYIQSRVNVLDHQFVNQVSLPSPLWMTLKNEPEFSIINLNSFCSFQKYAI